MANFLKSLFFGETDESEETKLNRNFDVLKYDGIKALKIGKNTYAIRCFNEALKLKEDEIGLFLIYCENDPKSKALLKPEAEFELIEFLVVKNEEFKRFTTFEK